MSVIALSGKVRGRGLPRRLARSDASFGYALALPALLLTLALLAYPLAYSLWISLHDVTLGARTPWEWVGLQNYADALSSPLFWPALGRTFYMTAVAVIGSVGLGLVFATALTRDFRGRGFLRGILILPWSLSQVTLALLFGWIFNSTFGPLNGALAQVGVIDEYVAWFADARLALTVMSLALVWSLVPFASLLFLGALQTVPEELVRAAKVDGAGPLRTFFSVTLPWIKDTFVVVALLAMVNAFLAFALIYVLTGGGPGNATTVLSWWGYEAAFNERSLGEGAAIFYLMTMTMAALTVAALLLVRRRRA